MTFVPDGEQEAGMHKDIGHYERDKEAYMQGKDAESRDDSPYRAKSRQDQMFNMGVSSQELAQEHFLSNKW